jgi:formyltetrahydrofolate deformylase
MMIHCILILRCADMPGIVAAVAGFIARFEGNILESAQFGDAATGQFFMRIRFAFPSTIDFRDEFTEIASHFAINYEFQAENYKSRVLVMVSRFDHCLRDLLYRWQCGDLTMDIAAIVSNHQDSADIASQHHVPFLYLPITSDTKAMQEEKLLRLVHDEKIDLMILARYMQVLSDKVVAALAGRIINIHHSFLPSFKGAKPYHQAYARGVKMIGATAHYVTAELDEGPIIEQASERVNHADSPHDLIRIGRDIEARVLARAVKAHLDKRVVLNGTKTVVF